MPFLIFILGRISEVLNLFGGYAALTGTAAEWLFPFVRVHIVIKEV